MGTILRPTVFKGRRGNKVRLLGEDCGGNHHTIALYDPDTNITSFYFEESVYMTVPGNVLEQGTLCYPEFPVNTKG